MEAAAVTFDLTDLPDPASLDPDALRALFRDLESLYDETDAREPEDEESEEYDTWLERLEELS